MKFFQSHPTHPPSTPGSESLQAARCPRRCLVNVDLQAAVLMSSAGFTTIYQWNAMDLRVNTMDGSYEWSASVLLWFCFVIVAFFWDAMLAYRRYTVRSNIPYIFNFFMTLPRFDRCWQSSNQEHCSWHTWESNNILGWSWKTVG